MIRAGRDDLSDYDISVCSLATSLGAEYTKVATVMFSNQEQPRKRRQPPSGEEIPSPANTDFLVRAISRVKDGLVLDDKFLGWTPLNDIPQDDSEFE